jgi:AraC-like DNA-binding protein
MAARYAEIPPRADLADHVACVWTFEGRDPGGEQPIPPDGRCELIVHGGAPYLEKKADGAWVRQPAALLAGQLTRPLHLRADGEAGVIGVRFRTQGAFAYLARPLDAFTDRRVPLDLADVPPTVAAVQDHVAARIAALAAPPDPLIDRCVDRLEAGATVEALCREAGLTPRTLQRRFATRIGVSPRMLGAIVRFRRLFEALREADADCWTGIAQAAGYFDHPQMARDFRRFVGCTPSRFVAARGGLAARLVNLPD